MIRSAAFAAVLLAFCSGADAATSYKWRDAAGTIHMTTDKPPADAEILSVMTIPDAPKRPRQAAPLWTDPVEEPAAADSRVDIVMYATSRCPWCRKAREYFTSRGVSWRELDIEASGAADREFKSRGGQGVPLIFINGSRVQGWSPQRIGALLDQALARR